MLEHPVELHDGREQAEGVEAHERKENALVDTETKYRIYPRHNYVFYGEKYAGPGRALQPSHLVPLRMFLNTNIDARDHSSCSLTYDEAEHWLSAVWRGYIDPIEALRGAEAYLRHAAHTPSARLLNDNSQLYGPWFESATWLVQVWVPQAQRLGLRYVAHVVQYNRRYDILTGCQPVTLPFELQIFDDVAEAQQWLRGCQVADFQQQ